MSFRKATSKDAGRCLEIYDAVSDWESAHGKQTCWEKGFYPTMDTVQSGLSTESMYALEDSVDGKPIVVACGIINNFQPEYYSNFNWNLPCEPGQALVLHTFAVDPGFQRRGYGQTFMSHYHKMAQALGYKVLRLDTVISNQKSQSMYRKLGFSILNQWEGDPNGVGWTLVFLGLEKAL